MKYRGDRDNGHQLIGLFHVEQSAQGIRRRTGCNCNRDVAGMTDSNPSATPAAVCVRRRDPTDIPACVNDPTQAAGSRHPANSGWSAPSGRTGPTEWAWACASCVALESQSMTPLIKGSPSHRLCCFCGEDILTDGPDPCALRVSTRLERDQLWFCHAACFKRRLCDLPDLRSIFVPAHF